MAVLLLCVLKLGSDIARARTSSAEARPRVRARAPAISQLGDTLPRSVPRPRVAGGLLNFWDTQ